MTQEKRAQLIKDGRLIINPDGSETRLPDPAVAEADLQAAIKDGRVVMREGVPVPTDMEGTGPDAEATPPSVVADGSAN